MPVMPSRLARDCPLAEFADRPNEYVNGLFCDERTRRFANQRVISEHF
jgi:hypothetical protein